MLAEVALQVQTRMKEAAVGREDQLKELARMKETYKFGDQVDLTLRLMSRKHLAEILANEAVIKQKCSKVADTDEFMMWLSDKVDPSAAALTKRLQQLEAESSSVYVYIYIYMFIYVYICLHIYIYIYMYLFLDLYLYLYTHTHAQ